MQIMNPSSSSGSGLDPYLQLLGQTQGGWNSDALNAMTGANQAQVNVNNLSGQQAALSTGGGDGYVMTGGNDMSGSSLGLQTYGPQNLGNPWSQPPPTATGLSMPSSTQQLAPQTGINSLMRVKSAAAPAAQAPNPSSPSQTPQSSYPSMPNSFGLGTQQGYGGAPSPFSAPQAPAAPQAPPTDPNAAQTMASSNNNLNDTTRGFNPWSLIGEANARTP